MGIGEAILYLGELLLIIERRIAVAGGSLKLFRLVVEVASKIKIAEVVLDFASRKLVAVSDEDLARSQAAFNGLIVATEHREWAEAANLCDCRSVQLSQADKKRGGCLEVLDGAFHLAVYQGGDSGTPCGQGGDLRVICDGIQQVEDVRCARCAQWVAAPPVEANILEHICEADIRLGR